MIAAGETAPDFTLMNQDGDEVSLADFRGKKLLIVFEWSHESPSPGEAPDPSLILDALS